MKTSVQLYPNEFHDTQKQRELKHISVTSRADKTIKFPVTVLLQSFNTLRHQLSKWAFVLLDTLADE